MTVTIGIVRDALRITSGNQTFTSLDCNGLTPKAALFLCTSALADNTPADNAQFALGATDGTRQWYVTNNSNNNRADADATAADAATSCITMLSAGIATTRFSCTFVSFGVNSVTVNVVHSSGGAYLMTVVLFCGDDLTVYADQYDDLGDILNLTTDIVGPGFTPDQVICASRHGNAAATMGMVDWDGVSVTQRALGWGDANGFPQGSPSAYCRNDAGLVMLNVTNGSVIWYGEFSDFDANGFSVTTRNGGADENRLSYLALKYNDDTRHDVITHETPVAIGNDSESGFSFTPEFVLLLLSHCEAVNTSYWDDVRAGSMGTSVILASEQYSNSRAVEDAADPTDTQSISDNKAVNIPDDDGSVGVEADLVSLDASGWTFDYTAVKPAAKLFFALAVGRDNEPEGGDLQMWPRFWS